MKNLSLQQAKEWVEKLVHRGNPRFTIYDQDENLLAEGVSLSGEPDEENENCTTLDIIIDDHDPQAIKIVRLIGNGTTLNGVQRWRDAEIVGVNLSDEPMAGFFDEDEDDQDDLGEQPIRRPAPKPAPKTTYAMEKPGSFHVPLVSDPMASQYLLSKAEREIEELKRDKREIQQKLERKTERIHELENQLRDQRSDMQITALNGAKMGDFLNSGVAVKIAEGIGPGLGKLMEKIADSGMIDKVAKGDVHMAGGGHSQVQTDDPSMQNLVNWYHKQEPEIQDGFARLIIFLVENNASPDLYTKTIDWLNQQVVFQHAS